MGQVHVVSFLDDQMDPQVPDYQGRVFRMFGEDRELIVGRREGYDHGTEIDNWLWQLGDWEVIVLFDVDCIPLRTGVVARAIEHARAGHLFGVIQNANQTVRTILLEPPGITIGLPVQDYIGPAFMSFSRETYERCGRPVFKQMLRPTGPQRYDCGEAFTAAAQAHGVEVCGIRPTTVGEGVWTLCDGTPYGPRTTYGNYVFHAWESRVGGRMKANFLNKCREVLGET